MSSSCTTVANVTINVDSLDGIEEEGAFRARVTIV